MHEPDIDKAWVQFLADPTNQIAADIVGMMTTPTTCPKQPGFVEWIAAKTEHKRWGSDPLFWALFRKGQIFAMLDEVIPSFRRIYSNSRQDEIRAKAHQICTGQIDRKISALDPAELDAAREWCPKWVRLTTI